MDYIIPNKTRRVALPSTKKKANTVVLIIFWQQISLLNFLLIFWQLNMARSLKRKHKKKTPALLNNLHCAREARQGASARDATGSGSEKRIMELEARLKDHKFNTHLYKSKYWNEHRKNIRQKKAYETKKIDHKRVKEEAFRMRGALEMLGKELEEVKTDCKESLQLLLNERINKLETAKKDLQHERTILCKRTNGLILR